ncbi:MAG TPA: SUMF1/EgtB/PvdO family nonheme iron enzyme [Edaphobacter sp.]|nr:SUMF1/EgtB/PvdO family nonheme iron enzyme [Edaphobacter sp.]
MTELREARAESDRLFQMLTPEAMYQRPIAQRHRVLFYLGHLDGFDAIQICREGLGMKLSDPNLDDLFQAGIDPDSSHLPTDTPADWPTPPQVRAYVDRCRVQVDENLDLAPRDVVLMALEHRQMHLETLAYMFHNLAHEYKVQPVQDGPETASARPDETHSWIEIPEGAAVLGQPRDASFGWDNEFDELHQNVAAFRVQRFPVTNGEYLRFVRQGAAMPHFWHSHNSELFYRGMFEDIPLPLDWPVSVTQLEAEAYAKFAGGRLLSEAEFHRAAYGTPSRESREYPWGAAAPSPKFGNFDSKSWNPEPVYSKAAGASAFGVSQLVGNGWEWTNTPFAPLPGFVARSSYPGYSTNFFDGEHFVMKGGSARTSARLLRRSFRNWFRPDYPYVYSKVRCVQG